MKTKYKVVNCGDSQIEFKIKLARTNVAGSSAPSSSTMNAESISHRYLTKQGQRLALQAFPRNGQHQLHLRQLFRDDLARLGHRQKGSHLARAALVDKRTNHPVAIIECLFGDDPSGWDVGAIIFVASGPIPLDSIASHVLQPGIGGPLHEGTDFLMGDRLADLLPAASNRVQICAERRDPHAHHNAFALQL